MSQLSISAWIVHGLGDKMNDDIFLRKLSSDINILLETWTGAKPKDNLQDYLTISKCRKKKRSQGNIVGIKLLLKCKLIKNVSSESIITNCQNTVNYRWTNESRVEIINALCDETIMNDIINFDTKTFSEDQNGINLATEELNSAFFKIADKSCRMVRKRKTKTKEVRHINI
ncbi:unnamed protein product [Mytilus coruscus]|uniref:Uncharacterized protein n=1 Tax=Mytilus coruscus TaxID=42192 RepID=A0A6J8C1W7_MYTCO|nr:unnamed protein product [Mytilus coruscus]